jgi:peptidyl-prolyl cis-trans isomerase C
MPRRATMSAISGIRSWRMPWKALPRRGMTAGPTPAIEHKDALVIRTQFASRSTAVALTVAVALATFALPPATRAADDTVVATVNGRPITEADVRLAEAEIGNDLGTLPPEQRRRVLVEYLIETMLFAEAGEKDKLASLQGFDERRRYWDRRAMRDTYFDHSVKGSITEAEAKAFYDKEIAAVPAVEEVRARHILVDSEETAKEIYEKIAHGADFTQMAKQFSKDPGSKEDGGDLGYFARGRMVPQFEEAAFKLDKGDVSLPVKSQFGWHLIKVEDKRQRGAPPFDKIKDRILATLVHRRAQEIGLNLRNAAKLEFVDPALKAQVQQETAIRPAPADGKR